MSEQPDTGPNGPELEQPFISHLIELRDRLLRAVLVVLVELVAVLSSCLLRDA